MILYSKIISPRLQYITDFIRRETGITDLKLTNNIDDFKNSGDQKINYSNERITPDEFWLCPHPLLFEKEIKQQTIDFFVVNNNKAFFKTEGDFPFDIFAAAFYLLSRYEEYMPHQKDMYGRYAHENSLAFKENFLNIPLINIWLQEFRKALRVKFTNCKLSTTNFSFLPTYDIDEAYSYRHKEWYRSAGASLKDLLKGNLNKIKLRRKVLKNKADDPFDSYDWMDNLNRQFKFKPRYFFLVPDKTGRYDRNILPKETALQTVLKRHADKYDIGIHPSWQSGDEPALIKKEIQTIESITKLKVTASRQHFIRFTLPQTFRQLINEGIKDDFSMGYGSINGFRASVASSFYWYDLEKEQTTYLLLYPFCYMEANSFYEQKFTTEQTLEEMRHYYNEVKKVNGTLITIWHNTFLGTDVKFKGWRESYAQFVKEIAE